MNALDILKKRFNIKPVEGLQISVRKSTYLPMKSTDSKPLVMPKLKPKLKPIPKPVSDTAVENMTQTMKASKEKNKYQKYFHTEDKNDESINLMFGRNVGRNSTSGGDMMILIYNSETKEYALARNPEQFQSTIRYKHAMNWGQWSDANGVSVGNTLKVGHFKSAVVHETSVNKRAIHHWVKNLGLLLN